MRFSNRLAWISVLCLCTGCGGPAAAPQGKVAPKKASEDDHHHGEGPHGGTIADWGGGKYHIEFTVDHDKKESKVYILGGDGKTPAPIAAKDGELLLNIKSPAFQVTLKGAPLAGEADGKSSCYVGTHDSLGKVQEFAGTVSGEVEGTPYAGDFKEEPHGHEHSK